ncbi:hypothetical protein [Veillonella sp. VA137]|uniref:hypothetical protein n=1 Tax=Veillonella sp. VA137 TaxID=741828 RepID=UPI000F8C50EB|nr:hypothetical protein [Veillonella sp. VA137]
MNVIKTITTATLGVCLLLVSGCFKAEIGTTIRPDGSIHERIEMGVDPVLANRAPKLRKTFDSERKEFAESGYTIKDTGNNGFIAEKDTPNIKALVESGAELFNPEEADKGVKYRKGFFYDSYSFDLVLPKNETNSNGQQSNEMGDKILSSSQVYYSLNLPEPPIRTNSQDISNENKTLRWNLIENVMHGKPIPIQADFLIHHEKNIKLVQYLGIAFSVGALGLLGIGIYRRQIDGKPFLIAGGIACVAIAIAGAALYNDYTHPPVLTDADRIVSTNSK